MATEKQQWPEAVGKTGEEAKKLILEDNKDLEVHIIGEMQPCTMDFRPDRVRVVTNKDGIVVREPITG